MAAIDQELAACGEKRAQPFDEHHTDQLFGCDFARAEQEYLDATGYMAGVPGVVASVHHGLGKP
jgi:hypothetical protein